MGLRYFNDGQEVVMEDFNALSKAILRSVTDQIMFENLQRKENAFFGDSFMSVFSNANTILVKKGVGFQTDATMTSPEPQKRPVILKTDTSMAISAPDVANPRIDIVCVKSIVENELTDTRNYKDAESGEVSEQEFILQKDFGSDVLLVAGEPDADPEAPATPDGYLKIAEVYVTALTGVANQAAITDKRSLLPIGGDITIDTTLFKRLTAGAAQSVKSLLSEIDTILANDWVEKVSFDLTDDSAVAQDSPMVVDKTKFNGFIVDFIIMRKNDSETVVQTGQFAGGLNPTTNLFSASPPTMNGDDAGVELDIKANGTITYTTTALGGDNYIGKFYATIKKI